jgi:hypothetical protein
MFLLQTHLLLCATCHGYVWIFLAIAADQRQSKRDKDEKERLMPEWKAKKPLHVA